MRLISDAYGGGDTIAYRKMPKYVKFCVGFFTQNNFMRYYGTVVTHEYNMNTRLMISKRGPVYSALHASDRC